MSLDVRITWSAAFAAVGNTQPRGAESKQRRRRSSAAAVCISIIIHAPRHDMVALRLWESSEASDVASARNASSHVRPGQRWRCRTPQHAQRGVYRKAELRAGLITAQGAGFCWLLDANERVAQILRTRRTSTSSFHICVSKSKRQANNSGSPMGWHTGHISWGRQPNECIEGIDRGLHQAVRLPKRAKPQCITRS